jgi:hypothetical protein
MSLEKCTYASSNYDIILCTLSKEGLEYNATCSKNTKLLFDFMKIISDTENLTQLKAVDMFTAFVRVLFSFESK